VSELPLPKPLEPVQIHIRAGYPILWILSWEERRVEGHLCLLSAALKQDRTFFTWSINDGFAGGAEAAGAAAGDPLGALGFILGHEGPALFVLKDFHHYVHDDLKVQRRLRDIYQAAQNTLKTVIILAPRLTLPPELEKEVTVIDYPLPEADEAEQIVTGELATLGKNMRISEDRHERESFFQLFLGLTADEIAFVTHKIAHRYQEFTVSAIDQIIDEKRLILRKTEILEFFSPEDKMEHVGGLDNFKRWAGIRHKGLSEDARKFGLPMPKGVLITGISGCGKSLVIKALADLWRLPLLRLDMGRVFAGFAGSPEESMRRAILTVEAVAPSILWIDEIEMGVSVFSDSIESGATSRIFASFLTWMQEKKKPVFIAATANDIDRLPPEFIRKGRFDEVFFVDLPNVKEREEIFRIHLSRRGKTASQTSIEGLAKSAEHFTGAEIEQALITAMFDAFNEDRELQISDIYRAMGNMVPLAITMKEQITKTKRWADKRAVRAS